MNNYKTVMCKYGNKCQRRECDYAHNEGELRHKSYKYKTKLCKHCFERDNFVPINIDQYIEDGLSKVDIEKLSRCPYISIYEKDGKIRYTDRCQFAHNEEEYNGEIKYSELKPIKKSNNIQIIETLGTGQLIEKEKTVEERGLLQWTYFCSSPVNIDNLRTSPCVF